MKESSEELPRHGKHATPIFPEHRISPGTVVSLVDTMLHVFILPTLYIILDSCMLPLHSVTSFRFRFHLSTVYVMLGQHYEFVGLVDHLQDRGLLNSGQYFIIGVSNNDHYDQLNPEKYLQGRLETPHGRLMQYQNRSTVFVAIVHQNMIGSC